MRVCIFTHTFNPRTGAGEFSGNLLDYLKKISRDIKPSVLTSEDLLKPDVFRFLINLPKIRNEVKKADIIHALDAYPYGVMAMIANWRINKPVIITAVGTGSIQFLKKSTWRKPLLKWAYLQADVVTAISHYIANELKWELGLEARVINHGVSNAYWGKKLSVNKNLTKLKPYVLTVGEMKRRKGYLEALAAVSGVMQHNSKLHYVIVTNRKRNSEYLREAENLIRTLGIKDKVEIFSNIDRDELRSIYQGACAYLLLPQSVDGDVEGFGLSVLEASAAGAPVVVKKGSGADDALQDGVSGFLVNSSGEAREKILELTKDKALHKTLSQGAKNFAKSLDWENQVKKYIELYEAI